MIPDATKGAIPEGKLPPAWVSPQTTTSPVLDFNAAKADDDDTMLATALEIEDATDAESPPETPFPQVMTCPVEDFRAAKASTVANTAITPPASKGETEEGMLEP